MRRDIRLVTSRGVRPLRERTSLRVRLSRRSMHPLSRLVFGGGGHAAHEESDFHDILYQLRKSFELSLQAFQEMRGCSDYRQRHAFPYSARSLLEISGAAIMTRIDPFRMLALRKCQMHGDYDLGSRAEPSFSWMGDIHTPNGKGEVNWGPGLKVVSASRALLDRPWDELSWRPAFESAIDVLPSHSSGWLTELRSIQPERFVPTLRGRMLSLYSAFSKGVHHEMVIDRELRLDAVTLAEYGRDLIRILSWLAFVSNFIEHSSVRLSKAEAVSSLVDLSDCEVAK